jgi:phosphatidylglycerophosphate synthase
VSGAAPVIIGALIISALLIGVLGTATASPPAGALPDLGSYRSIWQRQHHAADIDPSAGFLGGYLRVSYALSAPLARRGVQPDVLTLLGVWPAAAALAAAHGGGRWTLAAAACVVLSAQIDGLDGCVAGLTGRATARGYVLDSVADRVSDAVFAAALVAAGGRAWAGVTAVSALMMLEYLRARSGNAGQGEVGVVTVGERPSRVIAAAVGLAAVGVAPAHAAAIGTGSLLIMAGLAAAGFVQLAVHLARHLR